MKNVCVLVGVTAMVLSGCIPPPPAAQNAVFTQSGSMHSTASRATHVEGTDSERANTSAAAGTGSALLEDLLPSGITSLGNPDAPLTLLVVTNPFCAYCRDFERDLKPMLMEDFVAKGLLRIDTVILPLKKYPRSSWSASAMLCATAQGKGRVWQESVVGLRTMTDSALDLLPKTLKLDLKAFAACMDAESTQQILTAQASVLDSLHVTLVPTFFLNGEQFIGLPDRADLRRWIEEKP